MRFALRRIRLSPFARDSIRNRVKNFETNRCALLDAQNCPCERERRIPIIRIELTRWCRDVPIPARVSLFFPSFEKATRVIPLAAHLNAFPTFRATSDATSVSISLESRQVHLHRRVCQNRIDRSRNRIIVTFRSVAYPLFGSEFAGRFPASSFIVIC